MTALELAFIRRTLFNNIASAELPFMGNENYLPQQIAIQLDEIASPKGK
jgi:hypothetical protein